MLVIRVELHSARTGKRSEIARMVIANDGTDTSDVIGNYWGRAAKGVIDNDSMIPAAIMHDSRILRHAEVKDYARKSLHVWNLVARMLKAMQYG